MRTLAGFGSRVWRLGWALLLTVLQAQAQTPTPTMVPHDHEEAREALERGRVMHLHEILAEVEHGYQGQVLHVEFAHEDAHEAGTRQEGGRFVYKIRLLQPDGRVVKLKVDASNGRVLGVKRREH